MTAEEAYRKVTNLTAVQVVSEAPNAAIEISEPWVYNRTDDTWLGCGGGLTICSPGLVSCAFLRTLHGVRAWSPRDAR